MKRLLLPSSSQLDGFFLNCSLEIFKINHISALIFGVQFWSLNFSLENCSCWHLPIGPQIYFSILFIFISFPCLGCIPWIILFSCLVLKLHFPKASLCGFTICKEAAFNFNYLDYAFLLIYVYTYTWFFSTLTKTKHLVHFFAFSNLNMKHHQLLESQTKWLCFGSPHMK